MGRELAWVCAILPREYATRVKRLCTHANRGIGLSEKVFAFPLHISLKKSFLTDSFPEVREALTDYFRKRGPFEIEVGHLIRHEGMLWLEVVPAGGLLQVHDEIDALLESRFGIPRHRFDRHFEPHISLFTDRDPRKIDDMYEAIVDEFEPQRVTVRRIVVGAERERDTFLEL